MAGFWTWFPTVLHLYLGIGVLFGLYFVFRGAARMDAVAASGSAGFRLLILPGACALWPLLLLMLVRPKAAEPISKDGMRIDRLLRAPYAMAVLLPLCLAPAWYGSLTLPKPPPPDQDPIVVPPPPPEPSATPTAEGRLGAHRFQVYAVPATVAVHTPPEAVAPDPLLYWQARAVGEAPAGDAVLLGEIGAVGRHSLALPYPASPTTGHLLVFSPLRGVLGAATLDAAQTPMGGDR